VSELFSELWASRIETDRRDTFTLLIDFFNCSREQNFFKDAWNTFDFITVIGSIVDALVIEFGVRKVSKK
jgi:hypothetical protein